MFLLISAPLLDYWVSSSWGTLVLDFIGTSCLLLIALFSFFLLWEKARKSWIEIKFEQRGQCTFITGAGSGIGKNIAVRFAVEYARAGAKWKGERPKDLSQVFCGVRNQKAGEELKAAAAKFADSATFKPEEFICPIMCEITEDKSVEDTRKAIEDSGLALKVVINNAGISAFGFTECLPLDRYKWNMDVNFFGALRVSKAMLPMLRANTPSRLLNHGSLGAIKASGFGSAYLCSKAAMSHLNECLREELNRFDVKVVMVMPGFFQSNLLARGGANGAKESDDEMTPVYGNYDQMMTETSKNIEMSEKLNGPTTYIAEIFLEAATSRIPKARYVLGYDAQIIRTVVCYLPAWVTDFVFSTMHKAAHPDAAIGKKAD
jgi:NAD(P)-dependent dehydrogenase (short-subunit alcohol dehydrogenase family)